ncbi:MAG: D-alanyl-D-alanine carboxypeptidase [SAR324 cluster bacterium]|nr:D-alanyl-D-alanine carboxypeptidase [SAR324 cluster bacterium]MBL7034327.1 D-alanyl-D-alanine carboxypeptidase [SAR324 cluster bacterium]
MIHPNEKPRLVQGKTLFAVVALGFIILLSSVSASAKQAQSELDFKLKLLVRQGSVLVADDQDVLYRFPAVANPQLVPASLLKLATALVALHYLGPEFRFRTDFYLTENRTLAIKGYGDPFLVSEEWLRIAQNLGQIPELPKQLNRVLFDTSLFSSKIKIPGIEFSTNPYDAQNGALVLNFNTVFLQVDKQGFVSSAEKQTPLTPFTQRLGKNLTAGKHRISIPKNSGTTYAGELVQAFLTEAGFSFASGKVSLSKISSGDRLIYTHKNTTALTEVIAGMMRYSNNFTANQLLLSVGLKRYGEPATLEKGRSALEEYLRDKLGIPEQQFRIAEGSGISRKNRLTPEAVWRLLRAFEPYQDLLHGGDGILFKTGTLRGIYSMAGFLPSREPLYFVILLNQSQNNRDKILKLLLATDFSGT